MTWPVSHNESLVEFRLVLGSTSPRRISPEILAWSMWSHRRQRTSCGTRRGCLPHRPGPWQVTEFRSPSSAPTCEIMCAHRGMRCSRQESRPNGWGNAFVLWEGGGGGLQVQAREVGIEFMQHLGLASPQPRSLGLRLVGNL